ncbi:tRNA-specific 2-thiouridylase [Suillus fuscotomentosus]|uniref:tRNA-5-taurinomethyluridine 2-sulfurtransferase n=1 Tax=Suillus fuscotomentosus TaxID=1912939 RepID=A0AAD4DUT1_9AGAM|nr:tRNA-specific 2-thiouridylase [Suillus fuscotomentosus]KAG1893283.1 tRNA-specific 2-thiouridylase [Suillus fuscotomentosus]
MSGGVDSSVTAKLLTDKDYDLSAVFMRNWDTRDESGSDHGCEWEKDWEDVRRVCGVLDIPCKMVDLSREYWTRVFEPSLKSWESGITPNPDVWCNKEVKFGALLDHLTEDPGLSNTPWLATGHYANKDWKYHNGVPRPRLLRPRDVTKDQTYYLSSVPERSLSRAIFPLGSIKKTEVRELAVKWNLPTAARQESMGICFVGEKLKFNDFISQYIPPKPGPIIDLETGLQVGEHAGPWNFTIGQGAKVRGLKEKTFVVKKDIPKNIIYVVPGTDHSALYAQSLTIRDWTWIWADSPPIELMRPGGLKARIKFRHVMSDIGCSVYSDNDCIRIDFDEPQKAIAPGQVATIYIEDWCLGCGTIVEVA